MRINFTKLLAPAMLLSAVLFGSSAMAQSASCSINQQGNYYNQQINYRSAYWQQKRTLTERFQNQKVRIAQGVHDGSLTAREADMLRRRQAGLEQEFAATARVGYMTPAQYAHFNAELDQMSRFIYDNKHNAINQYNDNNHGYRPYQSYNTSVVVRRFAR